MNVPKRIFDILKRYKKYSDTVGKMVLSEKVEGKWIKYSTDAYIKYADELSIGLMLKGVKKGDKVATITNNRPQWNFADMGIMQLGAVHVTVYPTISDEEFEYILKHSESKFVFVSNKSLYEKIKPIADKIETIEEVFTFDIVSGAKHWCEVTKLGQENYENKISELEIIKESVDENDLATLIYTSGTTGLSKGVMLSHKNLMHNMHASAQIYILNHNHKALSFLPLSHVFAHMNNYIYQFLGTSIYYAQNIATVAQDINELQVDGFITVPRLIEAIFEKITAKALKLPKFKQKIFELSLKIGEKYHPYEKMNPIYKAQYNLVNKLVYSQWRKALSEKLIFIGCGGSSLSPRLARIFWAAGLPIFEGYGLTETAPILAVNYNEPDKVKIGTVGPILSNVQIKIAEDGEILAKGPNVMLGYYKDEQATKDTFTEDGWFKTGDIGIVDSQNRLKITDRKKEIFKLSNGKYIAPQIIENKLKESFLINQAIIVGENQKFPSALISPNFEFFEDWSKEQKIPTENKEEFFNLPKVKQLFNAEILKINKKLSEHEKVRKFQIILNEFSIKTGELSNSLKLKRKVIAEKYSHFIDNLYNK